MIIIDDNDDNDESARLRCCCEVNICSYFPDAIRNAWFLITCRSDLKVCHPNLAAGAVDDIRILS